MALRTSKITSEILQTWNKCFSSNADATLKSKLPATVSTENNSSKPPRPFRYKIANTEKPQGLPQLTFQDEGSPLFAELQPSASPEFRFDFNPPKWSERPSNNSPFPAKIRNQSDIHVTYSDQQKAEAKFVKFKTVSFNPPTRSFSTVSSVRYYSRSPADNSSKGNCKGKINKCVKVKRKECKVNQNKACPRFSIRDCKQSKGSHCELRYLDPHCVKKFAPYPSYSEACAEHLPDDPSECQQCPWRTCDDADRIEPGKPVRHKRHYSTCCQRHMDAISGVVVGPHLPPPNKIQDYICDRKCGVTKSPCKEPPGPCEVRKKKQEQERQEKNQRHGGSRKKKASDLEDRMVLRGMEGAGQDMLINPYTLEPVRINLDYPSVPNERSWIDFFEKPEVFLDKKEKHPYCKNKKKPKRPKGNMVDKDEVDVIEYGDIDWWSGRGKKTVVTEPLEVTKKTWRKKDQVRDKDLLLAGPGMLQASKKGEKRIKGDEGDPPPCTEHTEDSKRCPKEKLKKPKYGKRPISNPFYKRPEEPYNPID